MSLDSLDDIFKEFSSGERNFFGIHHTTDDKETFATWLWGVPVGKGGGDKNKMLSEYLGALLRNMDGLTHEKLRTIQSSIFSKKEYSEMKNEKNEEGKIKVKSCCQSGGLWDSNMLVNSRMQRSCRIWRSQCQDTRHWSTYCMDGNDYDETVVYFAEKGGKIFGGDDPHLISSNSRFKDFVSLSKNGWDLEMATKSMEAFQCIPSA